MQNPQVESLIERLTQEHSQDYGNLGESLTQACFLKYRDIVHETVSEYQRKAEFVRIYPAKNSKIYDKYFTRNHLNKLIYKTLFTQDLLPNGLTTANVGIAQTTQRQVSK